jgi:hypothetical protein
MKSVAATTAPCSFRMLILIGALTAPILLWPRASFAYLPAPLSPIYANYGADEYGNCGGLYSSYYAFSTSPLTACSQLLGYVYTSQVDGTSPLYANFGADEYGNCGGLYSSSYAFSMSPLTACSQFLGNVYASQVDGTSPLYANFGADEYGNCGSLYPSPYAFGTSPFTACSQFLGYVYPTLPAPINFTVFPKFYIGSVIYVPPGQGSFITYGAGTVTGSTVSTTSSWKKDSSWTLSIGIASITFGDNFGGQTTHSVDIQETVTTNTTYKPAIPSDWVNHDYDEIRIFLGVIVNASVDYLGNVAWGLDFSQIAAQGYAETGYGIAVGCLRPNSTIPSNECAPTLNFLTSVGITPADYPSILGADPFADPSASPIPDPRRYVQIDSMQYFRDPNGQTFVHNETNQTKTTNQETTSYGYTVGAGVSQKFGDDGENSLKISDSFTWTNSSTQSNMTGTTGSSTFSLSMPSLTYTGPQTVFVYLDTIFKTFMFYGPTPPCTPTTCAAQGDNCGTIADGCGGSLNCGSCPGYQTCGGGGAANVCGCTATTCAAQGKNCGSIADGCGGTLSCGSCSGYQTCGGAGVTNVCGCAATTCAAQGKNCGSIPDGCGGTLNCGTCSGSNTCGGGGRANVCGCTPQVTCADVGWCGYIHDGCGHTIRCGSPCP